MALTEQKQRFADRYFETLKGSESAIYAGYSEATSRQIAYNLLQEPEVEEYLSKLRSELSEKTGINRERILAEYSKIAFSDIRELYAGDNNLLDVRQMDDNIAGAVMSVEVDELFTQGVQIGYTKKVKLYNKLQALQDLGKHLGIFEKDNDQSKPKTTNIINLGSGTPPDAITTETE